MEFKGFPKMARLNRDIIVTEKIDGTNAQVYIVKLSPENEESDAIVQVDGYGIWAGSRTSWITPQQDSFGFAAWVVDNAEELVKLGEGQHFGEWWGKGIQRGYGLDERRFSLFNTSRWSDDNVRPACCHVVPVLYEGPFNESMIRSQVALLSTLGSRAAHNYPDPEGVVVFHTAANTGFKVTCKNDDKPKGQTT